MGSFFEFFASLAGASTVPLVIGAILVVAFDLRSKGAAAACALSALAVVALALKGMTPTTPSDIRLSILLSPFVCALAGYGIGKLRERTGRRR